MIRTIVFLILNYIYIVIYENFLYYYTRVIIYKLSKKNSLIFSYTHFYINKFKKKYVTTVYFFIIKRYFIHIKFE